MKYFTTGLFLLIAISIAQADFQTLTDIEAKLDPLDVLANYDGVRRSVDLDIRFALASAELLPDATHQLDALGEAMRGERLQKYQFDIVGHTDASGDAAVNMQLSIDRANSVSQYLQESFAIDANRLNTVGKGETALRKNTAPTDASQRRVEIIARALQGADAASKTSDENTTDEDGNVSVDW